MKTNIPAEIGPPYSSTTGIKWLFNEIVDHLWPWTRQGWAQHKIVESLGFALALATTIVWAMATNGSMEVGAVIGWWLGWSVYEIIIRMQCKPYIKDGPWWGHRYRHAGCMDMICYVMFKNLLIGAVFFIVLHHFGVLHTVG
jgi:NosR/NirI family transcriptional regulator, nitrous oxide reductase regulator